ncbi:MAG: hypothetical protein J1F35_07295 [Erysipelotrichales bacterium]|nr:hypothetical protein [Erysipelotrichales bacterium]
MDSRMEKYNAPATSYKSRTQKNKDLYNDVKNSALTNFDVNSNVSVIDTNAKNIDVNKLSQILDQRYNEYAPKRKSISVPDFEEPIPEKPLVETKEYDINAILEKAKQGKNVDYNKERLKKVRDAQYEILNNLDLEIQKIDDAKKTTQRKAEEDNLMNLINTITQIELKNKQDYQDKATASSLDLLSDLRDDEEHTGEIENDIIPAQKEERVIDLNEQTEEKELRVIDLNENTAENDLRVIDLNEDTSEEQRVIDLNEEYKEEYESREEYVEKTLSKLNIDISSYDDFSDVSKRDTAVVIIKVAIFVIIIALIIGAIYVLNILLDLGLF